MKDEEIALLGVALLFLLGMGGEKPDPGPVGPDGLKPNPDGDKPEPKPEPTPQPDEKVPAFDDMVNPDGYPTPGTFYKVQQGDIMLGIAKRALTGAAYTAAVERMGMSPADALTFASDFATNSRQYKMVDLITCESWNDATVTTHGYGDKPRAAPGSGRAIRLLKMHADNMQRLRNGNAAQRRMHRGFPADKANGVRRGGDGSHFETLYIPGLNLKAITQGRLEVGGGKWPDGSSKRHPPKWVLRLGVRDRSNSEPKGTRPRGCGQRASIEVK